MHFGGWTSGTILTLVICIATAILCGVWERGDRKKK